MNGVKIKIYYNSNLRLLKYLNNSRMKFVKQIELKNCENILIGSAAAQSSLFISFQFILWEWMNWWNKGREEGHCCPREWMSEEKKIYLFIWAVSLLAELAAFMKFIWLMGFFLLVGYGRCQRQGLRQKRENSPINQINEMNKARRIKERMEWIFGMKWIVWMEWKQWMPMEKMNGMVHQAAPAARQAPQQINNSFSMEIELWLCWWRRTWGRRPT